MKSIQKKSLVALGWFLGATAVTAPSLACGGFFCNQSQPVNQAAERIVFANNGDGTVTAVIQIMYDGPSKNFSWLLPVSSVPKDKQLLVSSNLAFTRLQQATNPTYSLTTSVEGNCRSDDFSGSGGSASGVGFPSPSAPGGATNDGGVTVEGSGVVGAYAWTVISVDPQLDAPADVAVQWLQDNGYDVPSGAPDLLAPYLEDGLYLLALRLVKDADNGSIRPIVLTYDADKPMIPVKLTAVAANDDMGVMTWLLGDSRAVPVNYYALELNEARINWFNASSNYNQVVIDAANDASGQGFVTEFAGDAASLVNRVWSSAEDTQWQQIKTAVYPDFSTLFNDVYGMYGGYDGFWDAIKSSVTFAQGGPTFDDFKLCPSCYSGQFTFSPSELLQAIEDQVIEPMRVVERLIGSHRKVTRLYTTLSAEEMTVDPLFGYNPDLGDVSNVHVAKRVIECSESYSQFEAPWRIELPQGGVIRGLGSPSNTWPGTLSSQPPNLSVSRMSESGSGKVVEDNTQEIQAQLDTYNQTTSASAGSDAGGTAGAGDGSAQSGSGNQTSRAGSASGMNAASPQPSGGCSFVVPVDASRGPWALIGLGALFTLRRRRASRRW